MKKVKSVILMLLVLFCITLNLGGCANQGLIPNGKYIAENYQNNNVFILTADEINTDFYWVINNGSAQRYISGTVDYKSKIIEENGVVYFEGYTWISILSGKKLGSTTKYMVEYDVQSKSITLLVV